MPKLLKNPGLCSSGSVGSVFCWNTFNFLLVLVVNLCQDVALLSLGEHWEMLRPSIGTSALLVLSSTLNSSLQEAENGLSWQEQHWVEIFWGEKEQN